MVPKYDPKNKNSEIRKTEYFGKLTVYNNGSTLLYFILAF